MAFSLVLTPPEQRPDADIAPELAARLERLAALGATLAAHTAELVAATAADIGTPCRVAALEVQVAATHLQTMAAEVQYVSGKRPYGTVAAIFPYDAAPVMLGRVGGAALLGGNTFRFSFSSQTPRTAAVLADLVAPWPALQPNLAGDNRAFGAACVADRRVQVLFLSGGGEVGRLYAAQAGNFAKLFFAGPSGMPAAILAADTPVAPVVRYLLRRAFINGGQYCTTLKKAYIAAPIYEIVKEALLDLLPEMKVGDPQDQEVWIGPIRVQRTRQLLQAALARLTAPRYLAPPNFAGEYIRPIICEVADVPDLEMFGPFLALIKVKDVTEAVNRAVRTRYPFAVSLFGSASAAQVERLQQNFGMVYLNPDFTFTPLRLPFGGKKGSGWIIENRGGRLYRRDGAFLYSAELVQPG
ncbi:MAG: aldehyde dehydrogenase family protein [Desulfobacca sp.]|uniref:aldehyde dehydrogenase family protein n=1 Tax=Desulfobacca sp. TaxID=2067990 RepID=UPI00404AB894